LLIQFFPQAACFADVLVHAHGALLLIQFFHKLFVLLMCLFMFAVLRCSCSCSRCFVVHVHVDGASL
jgi:hypothetical protein